MLLPAGLLCVFLVFLGVKAVTGSRENHRQTTSETASDLVSIWDPELTLPESGYVIPQTEPQTALQTEAETSAAPTTTPEATQTEATEAPPAPSAETSAAPTSATQVPQEQPSPNGANISPNLVYQYGGYYRKSADRKVIYLTFCMGYENGLSRRMMQLLAEKNVKAIFFLTGEYFDSANDPVGCAKEMLAQGHLIGSHGCHHVYTSTLTDEQLTQDFADMQAKVTSVLGDIGLRYYRPPYGFAQERDLAVAQRLGYITTMFSFYYSDYDASNQPSKESALASLKKGLETGAIYYLHVSQCNLEALPEFIDYARAQGYTFLRLDQ